MYKYDWKFFLARIVFTIVGMILLIILALVIFTPPKCDHTEKVGYFLFKTPNGTSNSSVKYYCADCDKYLGYNMFDNTPNDLSYLDVLRESNNGNDLIGGEYYTMSAIVSVGDYSSLTTSIRCKVKGNDNVVFFSVEFRDEFEDVVGTLNEGDEITFRGKFSDLGCSFTDCELINKEIK